MKNNKGFTLIEILVVIGIIAVLSTIVIIAINPAKQFAQARNTQRESNVNTILNALGQHAVDNKGVAMSSSNCSGIDNAPDATVRTITEDITGGATVDLGCLTPDYIPTAIPVDPATGSASDTDYTIEYQNSRFTVCAPGHAESAIPGSTSFCLTR